MGAEALPGPDEAAAAAAFCRQVPPARGLRPPARHLPRARPASLVPRHTPAVPPPSTPAHARRVPRGPCTPAPGSAPALSCRRRLLPERLSLLSGLRPSAEPSAPASCPARSPFLYVLVAGDTGVRSSPGGARGWRVWPTWNPAGRVQMELQMGVRRLSQEGSGSVGGRVSGGRTLFLSAPSGPVPMPLLLVS